MITTPCVQGGFIGQSAENFIPSVLSDTTGVWFDPSDIRLNWRKNFARYSEDITNAAWVKTSTTASASNPFVETAVSSEHIIAQTVTMGGICTFTFEVKDSSTGRSIIRAATGATSATYGVVFDLNSNAFSTIGTAIISCTSTVLADGYTRISITSNAGVNQIRVQTISSGTTFYLGDVTKGLYVRNLQVEYGSTFTGYQKITDGLADYPTYTGITIPTMYQDSVGSIIASQVEQPVGLILDKSKRLVLGSELVTNGDFSSGNTGWIADASVSFTGGAAVFTAAVGGAGIAQTLSVPVGSFICSFTVSNASSGGLTFRIRTAGGTIYATFTTENTALNKTYSFIFSPASVSNRLEIISPGGAGSPTTLTLDNISIKPLAGNHAYQATTNSRPYLRARQNRLTYSEQFENAVWTKSNTAIQTNLVKYSQDFDDGTWTKTNTVVQSNLLTYSQQFDNAAWTASNTSVSTVTSPLAPDGTATVTRITPVNGATSGINQTKESAGTKTLSVRAKFDTAQYLSLGFSNGAGYVTFAVFNLQTGTFVTSNMHPAVGTSLTNNITSLGNGWYLYSITLNGNTSVTPVNHIVVGTAYTPSGYAYAITGDGISSSYVWGAQLVQGAVPGDYRATTTTSLPILYTGPDGTTNASFVIPTTTSGTHKILQSLSGVATTGNLTYSVYVKAAGYNYVAINEAAQTGYTSQILNLTDGTLGNILSPGTTTIVTALSNGWYRLVWTMSTPGSPKAFCIVPLNATGAINPNSYTYTGDSTSGIYIANAQVVNGDIPGNYQRTLSSSLPLLYTAPDGTLTAQKLLEDGTNNQHRTYFTAVWGPATYTYSIYLKAAERTFASITHLTVSPQPSIIINLSTGEITSPTNVTTSNAVNAGNGWWRVSMTYTNTISTTGYPQVAIYSAVTTGTYTGDGSSGIYIWGADLRTGNTAGKYQRTTATAWNTVGTLDYDVIGQQPYLWFDGVDDGLLTNTIDFTATDKMTMCAGITKLNDANAAVVLELSVNTNNVNTPGSFFLAAPNAAAPTNDIAFLSRGDAAVSANQTATTVSAAPTTKVISALNDIAASTTVLRSNGVDVNTATGAKGAGNFGNYPLYIGRRGNASIPFTGQLHNLFIANKTVTSSQLTTIEKYVASKTNIVI